MDKKLNLSNLAFTKIFLEKVDDNKLDLKAEKSEISTKLKQKIPGLINRGNKYYQNLLALEKFLQIAHQNQLSVFNNKELLSVLKLHF